MSEKMEYPQVYRNEDGVELIALNDVQGSAFENSGFTAAGKYVPKQGRQSKTEE